MAPNSITIRPSFRPAFDIILIIDIGLLLVHVIAGIQTSQALMAGIFINLIIIAIWGAWVRRTFAVHISDETITGPAPNFKKFSFPRYKLDVHRTESLRGKTKLKGYLDLWSEEGKQIRLFRPFLTKGQIFIISQLLLGTAFDANKKKYRNL